MKVKRKERKDVSERMKKNPFPNCFTEECLKKKSETVKNKRADKNSIYNTEEYKEKHRLSVKKMWEERKKDKVFMKKWSEKYSNIAKNNPRWITKNTTIEIKIQELLKELNIIFETQKIMKIKHDYNCDIFIPAYNLVIECDGDYWHNYPYGNKRDYQRTQELKGRGYKVLRLWERDIKKMNKEELFNLIQLTLKKKETFIRGGKVFKHLENLLPLLDEDYKSVNPVTVQLDVSNVCCNNCYYCCAAEVRGTESMTREDISKSIDFLKNIGTKSIIFSGGGEPFCNSFTKEALEEVVDKEMEVAIITNAVLLTEENRKSVLNNCTWCRISLDSINVEQYQQIRGTNHFDIVVNNLKKLLEEKWNGNSSTTIGTQIVVNKYNYKDINNFINFCKDNFPTIDYIQIRPIEIKKKDIPYTKEEELLIKEELKKLKENSDVWIKNKISISEKWDNVFSDFRNFGFDACWGAELIGVISARCKYHLCCHTTNMKAYEVGDIREMTPKQFFILREDMMKKLGERRGLNEGVCPISCRGCMINKDIQTFKDFLFHGNYL